MNVPRSLALLAVLALSGCEPRPSPIAYGHQECTACRMIITDTRFGAELVTRRGKVYAFDAVECLIGFLDAGKVAADEVHSVWVTDFAHPGQLVDAKTASFLRTDRVRSPMGLNVLAFRSEADVRAAQAEYQGEVVVWDVLGALVRGRGAGARDRAPSAPPAQRP